MSDNDSALRRRAQNAIGPAFAQPTLEIAPRPRGGGRTGEPCRQQRVDGFAQDDDVRE